MSGRIRLIVVALLLAACGPCGPSPMVLTDTPGRKIVPGQPLVPPPPAGTVKPAPPPPEPVDEECVRLAGPRRPLEVTSLRLRGTIVGGRDSNAMVGVGSSRSDQAVSIGDYLGTHCWRVKGIDMDSITVELVPREEGASIQHTARIRVNDRTHPELAGLK